MTSLTVTRGLPASGKTTYARTWVANDPTTRVRVNRDDLRAMLFAQPTYQPDQETLVTTAARTLVRAAWAAGKDVITDDTNLRPRYVREWWRFARGNGLTAADFAVVEFPVDVEECIRRDAVRAHGHVGEAVIRGMGKYLGKGSTLLPVNLDDDETTPHVYTPPVGAPTAVIVDVDGTLALLHGRNPYTPTVEEYAADTPNRAVVAAVTAARKAGHAIVYCSGRSETARAVTTAWLNTYADREPGEPLFMRPADDTRRDSIVKRELFDAHIRDRYDVLYVLDDRNQVVDMWRGLGLPVFQVAPGDF